MADQSERGLLFVLSEPGEKATLDEFNDWYDNEHVPLRLNSDLWEFETAARYAALDKAKPGWMAIYEVPSIQFFHNPRYTKLRANRSPREADLVQRLETLDRRTGQWVQEAGQRSKSTQEAVAPVVVTLGLPGQTEVDLAETFHGIEGCRRATAWNIYDALLMRHGCAPAPNVGPKAFLVAEFDSADALQSDAYNKALDALKNQGVLDEAELRTWQLYRAWENTAARP